VLGVCVCVVCCVCICVCIYIYVCVCVCVCVCVSGGVHTGENITTRRTKMYCLSKSNNEENDDDALIVFVCISSTDLYLDGTRRHHRVATPTLVGLYRYVE